MKYLIKDNKVVFAGNLKQIFVYILCTFIINLKEFIETPRTFCSWHKSFLDSIKFSIKNEISSGEKTCGCVIPKEYKKARH